MAAVTGITVVVNGQTVGIAYAVDVFNNRVEVVTDEKNASALSRPSKATYYDASATTPVTK